MSDVILACEILEDEIRKALAETNNHDAVVWIDSSLHMFPQKLHDQLQKEIDRLDSLGNAENIILSFGYCGNAVAGLKSLNSNLILPRFNDCIDMLLHETPQRNNIRSQGCYFLTRGWLKNKYNIISEYDRYTEKYGAKMSKRIMDTMLAHYRFLTLIDTAAYPIDEYMLIAGEAAQKLNLQVNCRKGSIDLLVRLFSKEWNGDFLIMPPGAEVTLEHFETLDLSLSQGQLHSEREAES